jgi:hypothetical protein
LSKDEIVIKFDGGLAESHKLPAYNAAQSLVGITRSILIPAAYLEDGRVRYRNLSNTRAYQLNLLSQRPGSFESVLEFITHPAFLAFLSSVGIALSSDIARDFIYSIIKRCIGQKADSAIEDLEAQSKLNIGDMAALVDAIGPAMRDAHTTIGSGAHNIYIINGSHNVINLNAATKAYVHTSIDDDEVLIRDFSIASFNANTGNGRAFDYEAGHTIAFTLESDADSKTINAITESMRRYAHTRILGNDLSSRVSLKYSGVFAPDGKIKKIRIFEARSTTSELGRT